MTLQELKTRCNDNHISYIYGTYSDVLMEAPYLIAQTNSSQNFMADMVVYKKVATIQLDLYYISKDIELQNTIENNILYDVAWDKSDETYLEGEEIWQVSYYFEIVENI